MRLSLVLAAIAYVAIFIASQVQALPSADFCETNPTSPLCGGSTEPPVDPDPCDTDPSLCPPPPPPVSVCELAPALCEGEPPVLEPAAPAEPEAPLAFAGTFLFKGPGFRRPGDAAMALAHDAETFSLQSNGCPFGTGAVVAKGTQGKKFQLLLDPASLEELADDLARSTFFMTGRTGAPIAQTAKVILKRTGADGWSLKIKAQVVLQGVGEVVYKANLTSVDPSALPPAGVRCLE